MKVDKRQAEIEKSKEILEAIGQKNEHEGAKWVKYFNKLWEQKELEKNQLAEAKLQKHRRSKKIYYEMLRSMLNDMICKIDRPGFGYVGGARSSDMGIEVVLYTRWGKTYKRAMKPSGFPKYDLPAVMTLVGAMEDTMWHLEEIKKTDAGVYLV